MPETKLKTVTLERVPILSEGGPYYGTGSPPEGDYYKKADLEKIAEANRELASEIKAANKLGHSKKQRLLANSGLDVADDEQPAAGWMPGETFRVEQGDDGKWKLYADIVKVPAKLAKLFEAGSFRTRSVELSRVTSQEEHDGETGKVYESVVTGLAWLGAKAPAVRTLDDIFALYNDVPLEEAHREVTTMLSADAPRDADAPTEMRIVFATADIIWEPETGFQDLMCDLNSAINPTPPGASSPSEQQYWVSDVATSLDRAIVRDWRSNETWIVPFTMEDGEPVPAAKDEWTLAEQAWVKSDEQYSERNFAEHLKFLAQSADTDDAMSEIKKISDFTDEQVIALAKTFGLEGDDAATLRPKLAEQMKALSAEEPTVEPPAAPAAPAAPAESDEQAREMAELRRRAELGERAYEDRRVEKREDFVTRLMGEGDNPARILPAQADDWRKFYDENAELAIAQAKLLPALPVERIYGADDLPLPADLDAAGVKQIGEDAWKSYAAATGVEV